MLNISKYKVDEKLAEYQLYSFRTLKTPQLGFLLARVVIISSGIFILALFLPWQQNVRGGGVLTALNPSNRPQTLESAIPGRILKWYNYEGDFVQTGDSILQIGEIEDKFFDPDFLIRFSEQIQAKENSLLAKQLKQEAYKNQISAFKLSLTAKINQAKYKITQAELKLQSDSIAYESEKIMFSNYESLFQRNKLRWESGNITLSKYQEIESKYNDQQAKLVSIQNYYEQRQAELTIVQVELSAIQAEYAEKISKANSDLQATFSEINETMGEIAKMQNEYRNIEIRKRQYFITAPQSGYLVKALKAGIGETISEGEAIATILPENPDLAVELNVRAMDVPLIEKGRKVRIEFDGWPALQFSGWPSVSVGTFGGKVEVIDRINSANGTFRLLIKPDPEDEPWPAQLRLGSGIKGWVMLDSVPLWYEMWRQLNGFPPSLYAEPVEETSKEQKDKQKKKEK
jgi:adhesin transport system membrane fusion protein